MENRHAFGNASDVIDLGLGHFIRPIHELVRNREPVGTPLKARADSPVTGFMLWHECPDASWRPISALPFECPTCGDRGTILGGEWTKA